MRTQCGVLAMTSGHHDQLDAWFLRPTLKAVYDITLGEPVPDDMAGMLGSLSGEFGAGDAETGLTQPPSDILHSDRVSREIHAVHATSHNRCDALNEQTGGRVP